VQTSHHPPLLCLSPCFLSSGNSLWLVKPSFNVYYVWTLISKLHVLAGRVMGLLASLLGAVVSKGLQDAGLLLVYSVSVLCEMEHGIVNCVTL
jgi:hypothetical protein